jgi:hypothetical protein
MELSVVHPTDKAKLVRKKRPWRSKVRNGTHLFPTNDGRSVWARILSETFRALIIHCGGEDVISEPQRLMARRIGTLEAELIFLEDEFAAARSLGQKPEHAMVELYGRLADRQRRLSDPLGWQRTARDVTPSLSELVASGTWTGTETQ